MKNNIARLAALCCVAVGVCYRANAEASAIFELGAASEFGNGKPSFGPNLAMEITPIEDWLEIEGGVTPFANNKQTTWDIDLLFKKPFVLSETVEMMVGAGPSWSLAPKEHTFGAEAALDFMIWPSPERRFGWYVEPTYGYSFAKEHEKSVGISAGLLIAIP